jgi:hypothetical protein
MAMVVVLAVCAASFAADDNQTARSNDATQQKVGLAGLSNPSLRTSSLKATP